MSELTKKEIGTVSATVLVYRFDELMLKGEMLPAEEITVAEARETRWIEDELRRRLIKLVGHDFYPPDCPTTACIKPALKPATKVEVNPAIKIKFPVVVTNSLGSKAAQFTVEAGSKSEADILACKMMKKLGLTGATYKLS